MAKEGIEVIQANNHRVKAAKRAAAGTARNLEAAKKAGDVAQKALEAAQKAVEAANKGLEEAKKTADTAKKTIEAATTDHDEATKELKDAEDQNNRANDDGNEPKWDELHELSLLWHPSVDDEKNDAGAANDNDGDNDEPKCDELFEYENMKNDINTFLSCREKRIQADNRFASAIGLGGSVFGGRGAVNNEAEAEGKVNDDMGGEEPDWDAITQHEPAKTEVPIYLKARNRREIALARLHTAIQDFQCLQDLTQAMVYKYNDQSAKLDEYKCMLKEIQSKMKTDIDESANDANQMFDKLMDRVLQRFSMSTSEHKVQMGVDTLTQATTLISP
eukprot:scaffold58490_cov20-Cyclotella_meneghiniana.AAC.2